jgi:hypothetical protein
MKQIFTFFFLGLLATLGVLACGNSTNSNSSGIEQDSKEIADKAAFADSIKPAKQIRFTFENYPLNEIPRGWSQYYTGSGGTDWKVVTDNGQKVLAQLYSDNPGSHFNIIVNDSISATDVILSISMKGVKGNKDQGGGFVWRFKDKDNYYLVRANPLEDNVVLYKVKDGKRTDLPLIGKGKTYGVDVNALGNSYHTLSLVVKGDLFTVLLDDRELFKVQDSTFTNAGKVGLWTKADAVSYFDDYEIKVFK